MMYSGTHSIETEEERMVQNQISTQQNWFQIAGSLLNPARAGTAQAPDTIKQYSLLSVQCSLPIHVGVQESKSTE